MDSYSSKRALGDLRKGSSSSNSSTNSPRYEAPQFCNRIGCSGRINHTKHTPNQFSIPPKSSSSRSPNIKEVKKPLQESKKKRSSKPATEEITTQKSKSTRNESISRSKSNGQKPGIANYDAQIGLSRRNTVKKRSTEGETSSNRGKKISGPGPTSVRTRRSVNLNGNNQSMVQSTTGASAAPRAPQTEPYWLSQETSGGYNVDAIANVLLALERIDHDEGLTYEQIMSFDGNSFLGGYNLYDQHRDMRLDIDNMSYEELLVLEEKMGIVSTALSEEELSKCLIISKYKPLQIKESKTKTSWCIDDTKCSICQEEFIEGDEIGKMGCNHGYHGVCINQWLRLKNWCPVCKTSAKP